MIRIFKFIAFMAVLLLSVPAFAKSEFLDVLTETYKPYADKFSERSCANCHVSLSDYGLNPYGKQIRSELAAANSKELTPAILQKVEALDADQDGTTNIEEI